jgi:pectin methylesterase-like acyl-CoA thioesterase
MKTAPYLILLSLFTTTLLSAELRVGEGQAYTTITEALQAADPGDTVIIHEGIYRESCVVEDDNLTIVAAEGEHVVISGLDPSHRLATRWGERLLCRHHSGSWIGISDGLC